MSEDLSIQNPEDVLQTLPGWEVEHGKLVRVVRTQNWKETLFVVNGIAALAESHHHHPDLEVTFREVRILLWSHDEGTITQRDFRLAQALHHWLTQVGF